MFKGEGIVSCPDPTITRIGSGHETSQKTLMSLVFSNWAEAVGVCFVRPTAFLVVAIRFAVKITMVTSQMIYHRGASLSC